MLLGLQFSLLRYSNLYTIIYPLLSHPFDCSMKADMRDMALHEGLNIEKLSSLAHA